MAKTHGVSQDLLREATMKNMNGHRVGPLRLMFVLTVYAFSVPFSLFPQRKTEESKERLALVGGQIYPGLFRGQSQTAWS